MKFNIQDVNKPNFLIVGAAKAGTTSLSKYLGEHPEVYISKIKEPRFLITDTIKGISKEDPSRDYLLSNSVLNIKDYLLLFKDRKEKVLGESSVHYLYHNVEAISNIKKHLGDKVKIIIVLRNPVDRAISNWRYQDKDFLVLKEALNIEKTRIEKGYNSFWFYTELGFYYEQVKSYIDNFENTKVVLFEDLIKNTESVMTELYKFLNVDSSYKNENFKKHNHSTVSITPKHQSLKYLLNTQNRVNTFKKLVKNKVIPKKLYFEKSELITDNDVDFLKGLYKEDIKKLQKLINQDLLNWL